MPNSVNEWGIACEGRMQCVKNVDQKDQRKSPLSRMPPALRNCNVCACDNDWKIVQIILETAKRQWIGLSLMLLVALKVSRNFRIVESRSNGSGIFDYDCLALNKWYLTWSEDVCMDMKGPFLKEIKLWMILFSILMLIDLAINFKDLQRNYFRPRLNWSRTTF